MLACGPNIGIPDGHRSTKGCRIFTVWDDARYPVQFSRCISPCALFEFFIEICVQSLRELFWTLKLPRVLQLSFLFDSLNNRKRPRDGPNTGFSDGCRSAKGPRVFAVRDDSVHPMLFSHRVSPSEICVQTLQELFWTLKLPRVPCRFFCCAAANVPAHICLQCHPIRS
jgi:hypothetical protein